MALGTDQMTITTGANFIPELWGPAVIKATEEALVLWNKCWDWSIPGKGKGDIIHVPNVTNLTTNTKAANAEVTLNAPAESKVDLNIDTHSECSFLIEDMLGVQSSFNLMKYYTQKAGYAIAETLDTSIVNRIAALAQTVGSAGVDLGDSEIRDAIEFLDLANVPDAQRYLVVHPTQKNALFGIEKYFKANERGGGASSILVKGKFGDLYGVEVFCTTQIGTSGGARLNVMFNPETWARAKSLGPRTQSQYLLEYLGNLVVVDAIYGSAEARDDHGVWLKS